MTIASNGVFPVAPEPQRAYRVISDQDAYAAGLPVAMSEADMLREEVTRLRAQIAQGGRQGTVVDQGIRSAPPILTETLREAPPPQVPWDQLSEKTRNELEAGRRALGGGLSAREAYERSLHAKPLPEPMVVTPRSDPEPVVVLPPRTVIEQERGRDVLAQHWGERERNMHAIAIRNAEKLARGDRPTGDELYYVPDQPPV